MAIKQKGVNKKVIFAVLLLALIAIGATAAAVYSYQKHPASLSLVGVQVGDRFTYSITGSCSDTVPNTDYPGFYQLNETQYYNVTITSIQGDSVSFQTDWVFVNGTDITGQQTIDLSNGVMTDESGFSFLYPSNLKVSDPIYPQMSTKVQVNATNTETYPSAPEKSYTTGQALLRPTDKTRHKTHSVTYMIKFTLTGKQECLLLLAKYKNTTIHS